MLFSFFKKKRALPALTFRNTLSGKLERFLPLGSPIKMYNCGPTVYDRVHIGNLRSYIFADLLKRVLEFWGYSVRQVINITDVGHLVGDGDQGEDKMEVGARKAERKAQDIAKEYTEAFFEDLDRLSINRKKISFPKATDYIAEQIELIKTLEEKGYTYKIEDGMHFDTKKFPGYGKLGNINTEGQREGVRVEVNPEKRNPGDFALWKFSEKGVKRQQEWKSPWGKGFPGWHIECTAMIFKLLGRQIDIHTGGIDHIPVHHNNEIAQAESATGRPYVRFWLHHNFITIEGKKVSKSIGNTVYLPGLIDRGFSPLALRYWFLTGHYRSPMNFTWGAIEAEHTSLVKLHRYFFEEFAYVHPKTNEAIEKKFFSFVAEDLDTPRALAYLWEVLKDESIPKEEKKELLRIADVLFGLGLSDKQAVKVLTVSELAEVPPEVETLLREREEARKTGDYANADILRAKIQELGYEISDTGEGPKVSRK